MPKYDHMFIYLRTEKARMALKELSALLRKSPQRLKYMQSVLEKEMVLKEPYCLFDYSYFGQLLFRVYFKGGYIGNTDKERILAELKKSPFVTTIYELTGEFDLVVEFICPNPSRFNKELKRTITLKPTLNNYKVALNLVSYIFPRNYLCKSASAQFQAVECIIGGDRTPESLSPNELCLVKSLLLSPAARLGELSEACAQNPRTVKSALEKLKKKSIIRGFKRILDTDKLGISRSRLLFKLHNVTAEREKEFMDCLTTVKEIVLANKTVGDWDIEIDIESGEKARVRYIILMLRSEFKDLIESFRLIEFFETYKVSFLPMHIFQKPLSQSPLRSALRGDVRTAGAIS